MKTHYGSKFKSLVALAANSRSDIDLKPEAKPLRYRNFRTDMERPLIEPPEPDRKTLDWQGLKTNHKKATGKTIVPIRRRKDAMLPPNDCNCGHCNAPHRYLYLNDGKKAIK